MPHINQNIIDIVVSTVSESIIGFAERQLGGKRNFQMLDLIIPNERKIRSIVGGLETSMGTTLWEPLAKSLAEQNGFEIVDHKLQSPANMPGNLTNTLQLVYEDRSNNTGLYDGNSSRQAIIDTSQVFLNNPINDFVNPPRGKGVDIWLKKDGVDYFFDTKTVQPNLPTLQGCLDQVLRWYVYYYSRYPDGDAQARIVFPYNPYHPVGFWDKIIGGGAPLESNTEAWVENEFWDFCSGVQNTFALIKEGFKQIRESRALEEQLKNLFD